MNKYQEALNFIEDIGGKEDCYIPCYEMNEVIETFKELVDKNTPKEVITQYETDYLGKEVIFNVCPNCHNEVSDNKYYCTHCGQKLNWREEDEE